MALAVVVTALAVVPSLRGAVVSRGWELVGVAGKAFGDNNRAKQWFSSAIEWDPSFVAAYMNRGTVYLETGQKNAAMADYTKAIELDPENFVARRWRAGQYIELRKADLAYEDLLVALRIHPFDPVVLYRMGVVHTLRHWWGGALCYFEKALMVATGTSDYIYAGRAWAYLGQGDYARAVADFDEAMLRGSRDIAALYHGRALANAGLGRLAEAEADKKRAQELAVADQDFATRVRAG